MAVRLPARAAVFVTLLVLAVLAAPRAAFAESSIGPSTVVNGYPRTLTFTAPISGDGQDIVDYSFHYTVKGRGATAIARPEAAPAPGPEVAAEVTLEVNSASSYIPVGSEFLYHWEATTSGGGTVSGPEEQFLFLPPDQEWQSVANDFMTVYFHGDRESLARDYLAAGAETYQRLGTELYGVRLVTLPVKAILFADESESDLARPGVGGAFDAAVTTCGTKMTDDIILLIPVDCGTGDPVDTLRHEFAHILNEVAGEGPLGKLPAWMDEGAAVYAQSTPGGYEQAFRAAVARDAIIPFREMALPAGDARQVGVFYGQSHAMVEFLIGRDGPEGFSRLMATIKGGVRFDTAIEQVYGIDFTGFERAFRESYGLSPEPRSVGVAEGSDDGSGLSSGTWFVFGVALLLLLAALFSFLVLRLLANQRSRTGAPGGPPTGHDGPGK